MPTKRTSSGKLNRKSSSNLLAPSESEKNALTNMFKRIESTGSDLKECDLCHEKVKSCMIKDHQSTKCKNRVKNEIAEEIIILDDSESSMDSQATVKLEKRLSFEIVDEEDSSKDSFKRIKLEKNESLQSETNTIKQDLEEDQMLNNFANNFEEKINSPSNKKFDFYLDNFTTAIQSVLSEDKFSYLFDQEDLLKIEKFYSLSQQAKQLYVRLFHRKFKWILVENINYEQIASDLTICLDELIKASFLIDESSITTYEEIIYLFKVPQLKELAKSCHINTLNNNNQSNKNEMINQILKHFKTQKSLKFHFQSSKVSDSKPNYMYQCKKILGKCFKLEKNVRYVFVRALILYSLSSSYIADLNDTGQQKLLQLLMVNMKNIKYMNYEIKITLNIFQNKNALISYAQSLEDEFELLNLIDSKEFDQAFDQFDSKIDQYKQIIMESCSTESHIHSLPFFLRVFSSGSIYTKMLSIYAFEILQRLKKYQEANDLFEFLLYKQNVYLQSSRYKWFERLAINYESHLKDPVKSFEALKSGLEDHIFVKKAGRLALHKRLVKMSQTKKYLKKKELKDSLENLCNIETYEFQEAPTVEIEGTLLHTSEFIPGRKNVFIQNELSDDTDPNYSTISVEQVAMSHYIKILNYTHAKHAETTTLTTLFGILFWHIMFDDSVPNVFVDKFQANPLDLQTKDFYLNRKEKIDSHVDKIRNSTNEFILELATENWSKYLGTECRGVGWDLFESLEEFLGLLKCFTNEQLANLGDYMCKNFRYCRSGGPDLCVWSTENNKFKFVEVKGPGDHLSFKQMVWLDFLLKNSFDCEVCYVKGLNSKRLRQ